jgi:hypothetical protein
MALGVLPGLAHAVDEAQLEAAIVYNILLFAEWPPEALAQSAPVRLCVAAGTGLASAMKMLQGRDLRGSPIETIDLAAATTAKPCHAAFVDAAAREKHAVLLKAMRGGGTLVISDDEQAPHDAAGIVLMRAGTKFVFEVNLQPVKQARVQLSSKLLRLAKTVRE